jgi:hypothetical protein
VTHARKKNFRRENSSDESIQKEKVAAANHGSQRKVRGNRYGMKTTVTNPYPQFFEAEPKK